MNEPLSVREAPAKYQVMLESQHVRPGYKQTEVGVISEDWDVKKLLSIVRTHNSGIYKSQELYGRGHNIVGVSDIYGIDKVDGQTFAAVPLSSKEVSKHTLQCNDLLYGESSLVREGIARTVYVTERGAGTAFAWHTRRYSIDQRTLQSQYLYYYLQSRPARSHMISNSIQTAITGINTVAYFACPIIVPPIAEQEAIAEALSDADALIESLELLIAKKRHLKQGAMQELLTGKKRLPGFGGEWEVKSIGDVLTVAHGKSQHSVTDRNGIYPILATGGQIGTANQFLYDKPSVLIGRKGTIDRPQYMDQPFWTVDTLFYSVIHEPNNAKYLFYQFCLIDWKQHNEASGVPSLNARTIERIELNIPPPEEQTAIATFLSDMDTEIAALEQQLAKARGIKQGMMQELLTGRIRLV